ncbi:MAG TPA: S-layer homology domain-containing protein [Anaerolineales bacterium]|nr:S-layer homology domain-containing protein [Anaerolineales bacterium]
MKKKMIVLFGMLLVMLSLAFSFRNVQAATGCFPDTNGHWAETFICWLKANGITSGYSNGNYGPEDYVTRAQMAVFLQKAAEVPPSTGQIQISVGLGEWKSYYVNNNDLTFAYDAGSVGIFNTLAGTYYLTASPTQPLAQYGKSIALSGMEFCYEVGSVKINNISLAKITQTSNPTPILNTFFVDLAEKTNSSACIYYSFPPVQLDPDSFITILVGGEWPAGEGIKIGRTLLIYTPTTTNAPAPIAP